MKPDRTPARHDGDGSAAAGAVRGRTVAAMSTAASSSPAATTSTCHDCRASPPWATSGPPSPRDTYREALRAFVDGLLAQAAAAAR
ncbi:hypothetical protein SMD20_06495 [Nonomuraea sp. LP-02]|uniref:hypothetical protein n=1 Tax=Nonomuraea sp. LP-02 TaxID=3097960 RepID=UPI002E370B0D|nr:hypothetical protein [Nonomuraea sp. LP-02]MED7923871.1 hypothetical protein [Nonomuraea sp. LP-02]